VLAIAQHSRCDPVGCTQLSATAERRHSPSARQCLLQEPVAAAMAHGLGKPSQEEPAILVVDIGGGTSDISLLQCFEGLIEVIGYDGDSQLGGVDLDEAIVEHWFSRPQPVSA
jgi:actin-like ATPase involved in cell morphogenesis